MNKEMLGIAFNLPRQYVKEEINYKKTKAIIEKSIAWFGSYCREVVEFEYPAIIPMLKQQIKKLP